MRTLSFVVAALLAQATVSHAQAPGADVTVDQAVALYREHSPRLMATRASIDVTRADIVEARIYPNPSLGVNGAHTTVGGDTMGHTQIGLDLEIPILIGHQRARREEAANRHVDATQADVAVTQGEAELDIRARFAALLATQEQSAVLAAALADAKALRAIVAARTGAGAGSEYAVERIDLEIAALASRVDEAAANQASAAGDLAVAVGMPGWQPHAVGDLAPPAPGTPAIDPAHPALALDKATQAAAHADEARAHADAVPTPTLALQSWSTADPLGLVLSAGISMPLPLFDRNQGAVARARAEAHRAELELAAKTHELESELGRATRVLGARRDAVTHFQAEGLQRLAKLRTMAEASYRAGQGGIVELLDALDAITDARLRDIELRAAVAAADLDVRRAALGH